MSSQITYTPTDARTMLNPVKAPSMPFDWSINPYRGCQHGCSFCYARSTHAFLGLDADDTFQRNILYKRNAREALAQQLSKLTGPGRKKPLGPIAIGTATDPYQPVEAKEKLTRACLEVLADYGLPVSITTRSPLILRDLDLLKQMKGSSVNISLNTTDQTVWRQFEPSSPSPAKRLEAAQALSSEGIDVTLFMAPILPSLTDSEKQMEAIVSRAAKAGVKQIMGSVLRLNTREVKAWFFQTLGVHYPYLSSFYAGMYSGRAYAPDDYRAEVRDRLHSLLRTYGLPAHDPYRASRPELSPIQESEQPEQLSFSFD